MSKVCIACPDTHGVKVLLNGEQLGLVQFVYEGDSKVCGLVVQIVPEYAEAYEDGRLKTDLKITGWSWQVKTGDVKIVRE